MDRDGYGPRPGQSQVDRLLEDSRTLSPLGVERAAEGWGQRGDEVEFHEAERAALSAVDAAGATPEWRALRERILGLTERGQPLVAWRQEHGDAGHKAENALLAAALALVAGPGLDRETSVRLRRPLSDALPWLLGEDAGRPA